LKDLFKFFSFKTLPPLLILSSFLGLPQLVRFFFFSAFSFFFFGILGLLRPLDSFLLPLLFELFSVFLIIVFFLDHIQIVSVHTFMHRHVLGRFLIILCVDLGIVLVLATACLIFLGTFIVAGGTELDKVSTLTRDYLVKVFG
jgi:hypothetical protein